MLDQLALPIPNVCKRSEAIVLQLEQKIRVVKRLADKGQAGGFNSRWAHTNMMRWIDGGDKRRKGESVSRLLNEVGNRISRTLD